MIYIYTPKVYESLEVYNRQNNTLSPTVTNMLASKGIKVTPDIQGARNYLALSFTVSPRGVTELFRLFAVTNNTTSTQEQHLILNDSNIATSSGFNFSGASQSFRNVSGRSAVLLSSVFANTNEWRTVIVTIDSISATKTCNLYIDGILFCTLSTSNTLPDLRNYLQSYFFADFAGVIRSFQIWGSNFNSVEAANLHNACFSGEESTLTALFSNKQLHYNFIFKSDKISKGTNQTNISLNDWTSVFDAAVSGVTGTTSTSSTTITGISSSITPSIKVGMNVTGTGIPTYARVTAVTSTTITISATPTIAGSTTLNFTPRNVWTFGTYFYNPISGGALYISNDNGTTAGYLDSMTSYAYKDIAVTSTASILSLACFLPKDTPVTADFLKIIIANTSFVPQGNVAYSTSLSKTGGSYYGNSNILRQTSVFAHSTLGDHGNLKDSKTINIDLTEYEGQTVRIVLCFTADTLINGTTGTAGPVAITSAKMLEKTTIEGVKNNYTQLVSNGNFESDTSGWNFANGTNGWFVGTADKFSGTRSMYISSNSGVTASYNASASSISHAWKDISLSTSNPIISFKVKAGGEGSNTDYLRVRVLDATSAGTPVAGNAVISGSVAHDANINLIENWKTYTIDLTGVFFGSYAARLVFTWINDASVGTQPGALIDNVCTSGEALISSEPVTVPIIFDYVEYSDKF